jgi:hypothetical protein
MHTEANEMAMKSDAAIADEVFGEELMFKADLISPTSEDEIQTVLGELKRISGARQDLIVPWRVCEAYGSNDNGTFSLYAEDENRVSYGLPLSKIAHRQLAERMGIPFRYYTRMFKDDPELLATNVNRWIEDLENRMFLARMLDGRYRAILSDRYKIVDGADMFFEIYPVFNEVGAAITNIDVTEERFYIRALHPEWRMRIEHQQQAARNYRSGDVRDWGFAAHEDHGAMGDQLLSNRGSDMTRRIALKGLFDGDADDDGQDWVIPGIVVSTSDVGMGRVLVEPRVFRLICMNGVTLDQAIAKIHLGAAHEMAGFLSDETIKYESAFIMNTIRDTVKATFDQDLFRRMVARLTEATGAVLDNPVEAVENIVKSYSITDADKDRIINELVRGGDNTVFGLLNAVTAVGREKGNYNEGIALERAGGDLLENFEEMELVRVR